MKQKHLEMYMRIAKAVAQTSSAKRLKVGAVAVKNNRVIGTGYNAMPTGVDDPCEFVRYCDDDEVWEQFLNEYPYEDEGGHYRLVTDERVRHGEANLLLNLAKGTESSTGCTIFCTHACCKFCAMDIVDSGCEKFYYREDYRDSSGLDYLKSNGVVVEQI